MVAGQIKSKEKHPLPHPTTEDPRSINYVNMGTEKRVVSLIGSSTLLSYALVRRDATGIALALGGLVLGARGAET